MAVSDLDQFLVEVDAARFVLASRSAPKLVIARNPDELLEFSRQRMKTPVELMKPVDNVACKDQPVFPERGDRVECLPIDGIRQVKIRERK